MNKRGKHYALRHRKQPADGKGDTKEFAPPRSHRTAAYFLFTLFVCVLLALLAAAVLSVDYFGRAVSDGADPTLAFAVSEEGKATLSLLGRSYDADVSFLAPAAEFLDKTVAAGADAVPDGLKLFFRSVPELYRTAAELTAKAEKAVTELVSGIF